MDQTKSGFQKPDTSGHFTRNFNFSYSCFDKTQILPSDQSATVVLLSLNMMCLSYCSVLYLDWFITLL